MDVLERNPFRDDPEAARMCVSNFKKHELDGLIVIGGNSSMGTAMRAEEQRNPCGRRCRKTIDNDVEGTDVTIGFDTAVATAAEAIESLRTTAESHDRVMIVETMGRDFGWIAVAAGIAGGADMVLTPEEPVDVKAVARTIRARQDSGIEFTIIVIGEGRAPSKVRTGNTETRAPTDRYMHLSGRGSGSCRPSRRA